MKMYQVRLEVCDGYTWVTVFDPVGDEFLSAKLDDVLKVPNAIYDIPTLAHENDRDGLVELYLRIGPRTCQHSYCVEMARPGHDTCAGHDPDLLYYRAAGVTRSW